MSVMIISFEASANIDTSAFGYFSLKYDPEFFSAIKENLTEIKKSEVLSFPVNPNDIRLTFSKYDSVRRVINLSDVEKQKFTSVYNNNFDHFQTKRFESVKLHIDKDYFYFTGTYANSKTEIIQFQSLNFDLRFIDSLEEHCKSVVN